MTSILAEYKDFLIASFACVAAMLVGFAMGFDSGRSVRKQEKAAKEMESETDSRIGNILKLFDINPN